MNISSLSEHSRRYIETEIDKYLKKEMIYDTSISDLIDHDLVSVGYEQKVFDKIVSDELHHMMMHILTKRELTVMQLYYDTGLTMDEIGIYFNVTGGRISQIHAKCIRKIRRRLTNDSRFKQARVYAGYAVDRTNSRYWGLIKEND